MNLNIYQERVYFQKYFVLCVEKMQLEFEYGNFFVVVKLLQYGLWCVNSLSSVLGCIVIGNFIEVVFFYIFFSWERDCGDFFYDLKVRSLWIV